jgi:hypothetical protein
MFRSSLRYLTCFVSLTAFLHAGPPNISNLNQCIDEVREANANPPFVPTFDPYASDYQQLLIDLEAAIPHLPYVYQEAAAKPLIDFLRTMGEARFLQIFNTRATDSLTAALQQIIPDAALSVLVYDSIVSLGVNAFEEVVADLYDCFLSNEKRINKQGGTPIEPPTYGVIPPLVKFGNAEAGPYTWPVDATSQLLGLKCGIVSLPPAQLNGGILAWATLGHETGGHDVTHADAGLLNELGQKVYAAIMARYHSPALASYWAKCIDESSADVCGILNLGPSAGIGLIGYFRALGNGKLRVVGGTNDPHPIDLLRGYLGAGVVKRLNFKAAAAWSQIIFNETKKDNGPLYFVDQNGMRIPFPVAFADAVSSADLVAEVIMRSKLNALQGHSLQEIDDWQDIDQDLVDNLVPCFKNNSPLPANLNGPDFYAAYVVAGATQAGLQGGAALPQIFTQMQIYLASMHFQNPTWSTTPNKSAIALLERVSTGYERHQGQHFVREDIAEPEVLAVR